MSDHSSSANKLRGFKPGLLRVVSREMDEGRGLGVVRAGVLVKGREEILHKYPRIEATQMPNWQ